MANVHQDERLVRIKRLEDLRKQGIDPYPAQTKRDTTIGDAVKNFEALSASAKTVTWIRIRLRDSQIVLL